MGEWALKIGNGEKPRRGHTRKRGRRATREGNMERTERQKNAWRKTQETRGGENWRANSRRGLFLRLRKYGLQHTQRSMARAEDVANGMSKESWAALKRKLNEADAPELWPWGCWPRGDAMQFLRIAMSRKAHRQSVPMEKLATLPLIEHIDLLDRRKDWTKTGKSYLDFHKARRIALDARLAEAREFEQQRAKDRIEEAAQAAANPWTMPMMARAGITLEEACDALERARGETQ